MGWNTRQLRPFRVVWIGALALSLLMACGGALGGDLYHHPSVATGQEPYGLAAGDFNEDGLIDLVVGHGDGSVVVVVLGRGDGSFLPLPAFDANDWSLFPAVADFNEDGHEDITVSNQCMGGVSVRLGNGDGTFGEEAHFGDTTVMSRFVAVGNFNGDEHADLLTSSWSSGCGVDSGATVLLGHGDGTFSHFGIWGGGYSLAVADFDGDGLDDYATVSRIALSNGDGTFELQESYSAGDDPHWVTAGDLNQDDIPDLVVTNEDSDDLSVLMGNGDGTLAPEQRYSIVLGDPNDDPYVAAISDLDDDGLNDVIVSWWWAGHSDATLSVLYGTGGGQLAPSVAADTNRQAAASMVIEDFNQDGIKDVARPSWWHDGVNIVLGTGDRSFAAVDHVFVGGDSVGGGTLGVVASDLDADGRLDLAMTNGVSNDVWVLMADGAGSFAPPNRFCVIDAPIPCPAGSTPSSLELGELTGDTHSDLFVTNRDSNEVSVLEGDGTGSFSYLSSTPVLPGTSPLSVVLGDLDNDDVLDAAVVGQGSSLVTALLGNGDGTFGTPPGSAPMVGTGPRDLTAGFLNGDAFLDLAVANGGSDDVSILLGQGDGSFTAGPSLGPMGWPTAVAIGDINEDDIPDLIVGAVKYRWEVHVFAGLGDGTFSLVTKLRGGVSAIKSISIADLDGDSRSDLAVLTGTRTLVFLGHGDGTFESVRGYASGGHDHAVGDFNLDSREDLAGAYPNWISLLFNLTGPSTFSFLADGITLAWPAVTGALSYDLYRGNVSSLIDVDDDGLPDDDYGVCLSSLDDDTRDTFFVDADVPSSGGGFFYLMSVIDAQGDNGLGTTSAGLPRSPQVACP